MSAPLLYITGTNTSVGKTTLATLLLARARHRNISIAALKPFCSGGRQDAEKLHALQTAGLSLDEVNPFYFEEPISPYVAARNSRKRITLAETLEAVRTIRTRGLSLLIEGAGGLLSPLGEKFTLLDIIREIPGDVCIVGTNELGVINAALLTHHALQSFPNLRTRFVLMNSSRPDVSTTSNASVIGDWTGSETLAFSFLREHERSAPPLPATNILDGVLDWWLPKKPKSTYKE